MHQSGTGVITNCGRKGTHNWPMLSVFADCHRCLNNSMSSKNLNDRQWDVDQRRESPSIASRWNTYQVLYPPI